MKNKKNKIKNKISKNNLIAKTIIIILCIAMIGTTIAFAIALQV